MLQTMTLGEAARWAGVSPSILGLMLTGRWIDPTSELDVETGGLPPEMTNSLPGHPAVDCGVAAGDEAPAGRRQPEVPDECHPVHGASAREVHPATEEDGRQPKRAAGADAPRPRRGAARRGVRREVPKASWRAGRRPQKLVTDP